GRHMREEEIPELSLALDAGSGGRLCRHALRCRRFRAPRFWRRADRRPGFGHQFPPPATCFCGYRSRPSVFGDCGLRQPLGNFADFLVTEMTMEFEKVTALDL